VNGHTGSSLLTRPQLRLCDSHHYWTLLTHCTYRTFRCHNFSCVSNKDFPSRKYQNSHYHILSDDKPFKCEICYNRYIWKSHLRNHTWRNKNCCVKSASLIHSLTQTGWGLTNLVNVIRNSHNWITSKCSIAFIQETDRSHVICAISRKDHRKFYYRIHTYHVGSFTNVKYAVRSIVGLGILSVILVYIRE
jgi:hypothetical protein